MKTNMGSIDRMIRLMIAVVLSIVVIAGVWTGTWAIIALIGAVVMAGTSFLKFCPLYLPFGINTCKKD
ncbi:MAG: DUF2892 domain-containing protein [Cytophagaceae bacterium]|jgi:hypothetical protein|nr:DUF2892 domain-containing protein [Cytophagaceae bacterium]